MPPKLATIKKTSPITSAKGAVSWADGYCNEVHKHKGKEVKDGIEIGKTYFTSRPIGTLSIHGYGKKKVELIARTTGNQGNDAIIDYIRAHCETQQRKGRKIMGLRMILSMDPERVTELMRDRVDIDRLIVRAADQTFQDLTNQYYPNDELCFIMGIHHDVKTNNNKSWIERQKAAGVYKDKPSHPHIHAHVLLLPQTRKGLRISLSNHTCPARDGVYVDMLDSLIDVYQSNIRKIVYNLDITPYNQITPEWECLIREACINTVDDFYKLKSPIPDIKVARRFGLDKFSYHLRTMSQESLQFKHNLRRQQFLQFTQEPVQTNKSTLLSTRQELSTILSTNSIRRSQHIQEIITQFKPDSKKPLHLWATSPISVCEEPFKISPNRSSILKKAIQEFEEMRRASQLQSISEISRIELRLASLKQPAIEPNWVYNLGKVAQLDVLPHQEILDTAINTGPKIPTEAITNPNQINQIPKSSPEIEVKH